jgi:hypothetical protein
MGAKAAVETGAEAAGGASAASTALPFVGLGVNLLQTGMGLVQASEQAAAQREAQRQAEIATKMQIQQQEQNFFEAMRVPTEAYDRALREGTAQQAQALASLQEGDPRLLAGGVGKVQAAAGDYNAQARDAMAQQMFDLQKLQAQEKMLNADDLAKIYENRTIGAQKAAAAAELAQVGALTSALTGITDFATRLDAGRKEYKQQMPISNTGANIGGVTGTGINLVDTNSQSPVGSMFTNQSKFVPSQRTQTGGSGLGAISGYDPNVFANEQSIFNSVSSPKPKQRYKLPNYYDPYTGEYIQG